MKINCDITHEVLFLYGEKIWILIKRNLLNAYGMGLYWYAY